MSGYWPVMVFALLNAAMVFRGLNCSCCDAFFNQITVLRKAALRAQAGICSRSHFEERFNSGSSNYTRCKAPGVARLIVSHGTFRSIAACPASDYSCRLRQATILRKALWLMDKTPTGCTSVQPNAGPPIILSMGKGFYWAISGAISIVQGTGSGNKIFGVPFEPFVENVLRTGYPISCN
jgi:hypothetical protein